MSGPLLGLSGVGYRYPGSAVPALDGVDLAVAPGEIVLLTGPTGCGKSTLLRLASGLAARHGQGELRGAVRLGGEDPARLAPAERVTRVGLVGQVPGDQLVAGTVADEVAFGPESAGWPPGRIARRVEALLDAVGLDVPPDRDPRTLSGGQQQRLVVAAALAAGARLLLLDEPLAWLDPLGASELVAGLRRLADRGVGVLLVEHRLSACWWAADRVVVLREGRVVHEAPPAGVDPALLAALGLERPGAPAPASEVRPRPPGRLLVRVRGLRHRWPGAAREALAGVDLEVRAGEQVALVGGNGAGKSTLLAAVAGDIDGAGVERLARVVDVPQDPDLALFCETVAEELAHGPREARLPPREVADRVALAAAALSVADLLERPPQALSRGQRLRVAVAAALAAGPELLLLDEPTSGQDRDQVDGMFRALAGWCEGRAVLWSTHDLGSVRRHATRVVVLHAGRVVADGPPAAVLGRLPPGLPLEPRAPDTRGAT